jgi:hypothetical protein
MDVQRAILRTVGRLGVAGMDRLQIAEAVGEPEFRVQAELKALERLRYVRKRPRPDGDLWLLTARGWEAFYVEQQLNGTGSVA